MRFIWTIFLALFLVVNIAFGVYADITVVNSKQRYISCAARFGGKLVSPYAPRSGDTQDESWTLSFLVELMTTKSKELLLPSGQLVDTLKQQVDWILSSSIVATTLGYNNNNESKMIKMESTVESGTNDNTAAPITTSAETMVASRSFTSVEGPLIPFELIQRGNRRACNPVTQAEVDQVYSGIDHVTNLADMDSSHSQPIAARGWIALIERGGCGFIDKIRHAQAVGASAVIVGDHEGIGLIAMIADVDASDVKIPAVFLRRRCYRDLLHHATAKATFITVKITGDTFSSWFTYDSFLGTWLLYSVLFYIVLSILWATWHIIFGPIRLPVIQGTFTIRFSSSRSASTNTIGARVPAASPAASPAEHARRTLRQLRVDLHAMWRRLDGWRAAEEQVRQIPMVTFSTTEAESITDFPRRCAICLEDFIDGDRLRLLPCRHRFHANCVDRWLITRRRLCPICKQDITIARAGNHNTTSASASASPSSTVVNHDNDNASSSHSPIASTNEEIEHASTSNDTNNQDQDEIALNDGSSNNDNNHRRTVSEATPRPNYWAN